MKIESMFYVHGSSVAANRLVAQEIGRIGINVGALNEECASVLDCFVTVEPKQRIDTSRS